MSATASDRPSAAALGFLWLTGLWIGTVATFKLLAGNPADLPAVVRDLPLGIELGLLFKIIIGIEFGCVGLAAYTPKLAWPFLLGALLTFDGILVQQLLTGSTSCGCFGGAITMDPRVMLGIDSVLLLGILFTRPWRMSTFHPPGWLSLPLVLGLAYLLPIHFDRQVKDPPPPKRPQIENGGKTGEHPKEEGTDAAENVGQQGYVVLEPQTWVGKSIFECQVASYVGEAIYELPLPQPGLMVLWRQDCHECAHHLEILATQTQNYPAVFLIQLRQAKDTPETNLVHIKPMGPNVFEGSMPATYDYVATTPVVLELDADGKITSAQEGAQ